MTNYRKSKTYAAGQRCSNLIGVHSPTTFLAPSSVNSFFRRWCLFFVFYTFFHLPLSSANMPFDAIPPQLKPCLHDYAFHCSLCFTAGFSSGDHDHSRHTHFMCKHCGIPFNAQDSTLQLVFCQNCSGIRELTNSNTKLEYHCGQGNHFVCDECLDLFLPREDALLNKSLYTSLDDTFKQVFNTTEWALVCPLCTEEGHLPDFPSDLEEWIQHQSRPETFTSFAELGKACRTIVGRREEVQLLLCEELLLEGLDDPF